MTKWKLATEAEPVLVVETEPGYWNRGHYHEGSKSYIDPTKVWRLPAGTKLYTAPPAPKLSDERILEIYEEAKANWNAQADQCNQWSDLGVDEVVTLVARAVEREILGGAQS